MVCMAALVVASSDDAVAKEHFRRVYRRSRTVVVRQEGVSKKVPTNTYYAAYDETSRLLLPSWRVRTIENNRGLRYVWRVTDHDTSMSATPDHVRVSPRRPRPNDVEPLSIDDHLDNFHGRR